MIDIAKTARIYVSGHTGLVGSAIVRRLNAEGLNNTLSATREQLDLRDQAAVNYWFKANRPGASWPTRHAQRSSSTTT